MTPDTVNLLVDVISIVLALALLGIAGALLVAVWVVRKQRKMEERHQAAFDAVERGTRIRHIEPTKPWPKTGRGWEE